MTKYLIFRKWQHYATGTLFERAFYSTDKIEIRLGISVKTVRNMVFWIVIHNKLKICYYCSKIFWKHHCANVILLKPYSVALLLTLIVLR